jgi:hypothetical protein
MEEGEVGEDSLLRKRLYSEKVYNICTIVHSEGLGEGKQRSLNTHKKKGAFIHLLVLLQSHQGVLIHL